MLRYTKALMLVMSRKVLGKYWLRSVVSSGVFLFRQGGAIDCAGFRSASINLPLHNRVVKKETTHGMTPCSYAIGYKSVIEKIRL